MTDYGRETEIVDAHGQPVRPGRLAPGKPADRRTCSPGPVTLASRIVTFAFGVLQALLILRIILLLLVANPGNDIVSFILGVTDPFVEPFIGMFDLNRVTADSGSARRAAIVPDQVDAARGDHPRRPADLQPEYGRSLIPRAHAGSTTIGPVVVVSRPVMPVC